MNFNMLILWAVLHKLLTFSRIEMEIVDTFPSDMMAECRQADLILLCYSVAEAESLASLRDDVNLVFSDWFAKAIKSI